MPSVWEAAEGRPDNAVLQDVVLLQVHPVVPRDVCESAVPQLQEGHSSGRDSPRPADARPSRGGSAEGTGGARSSIAASA